MPTELLLILLAREIGLLNEIKCKMINCFLNGFADDRCSSEQCRERVMLSSAIPMIGGSKPLTVSFSSANPVEVGGLRRRGVRQASD